MRTYEVRIDTHHASRRHAQIISRTHTRPTMSAAEPPSTRGGTVALLDLPPGSSLSVDGSTQIIRREDFVGIYGVPTISFHLVVVSSAGGPATNTGTCTDNDDVVHGSQTTISTPSALHTTGFVLMRNSSDGDNDGVSNHDEGWIVARRYDPQTEEICSTSPDGITCSNLQRSIQDGSIGPQRVVPYHRFIENQTNPDAWKVITSFISSSLLQMRGIASGEKIVPGAYEEDFDDEKRYVTSDDGEGSEKYIKAKDPAESTPRDGISICYPPMPCIEGSHMARTGHAGTKRYLSHLSPSDRTALFLDTEPGTKVLDTVLRTYYDGSWEELVGDVQLSFLLFLHLGCLSSFEHWRDTISMLSLVGSGAVSRHAKLYCDVFSTISCHLSSIEQDFFEEVEYSGGNFFLPALNRFVKLCCECGGDNEALLDSVREIRQIVHSRFGIELVSISRGADTRSGDDDDEEEDDVMEVDVANGSAIDISAIPTKPDQGEADVKMQCLDTSSDDGDDEDDDGPVVVAEADVEASLERSAVLAAAQASIPSATHITSIEEDRRNRRKFPLIFAAISSQEDILMCCARVLDEKNDVSLVREAAAYLEAVESKRD